MASTSASASASTSTSISTSTLHSSNRVSSSAATRATPRLDSTRSNSASSPAETAPPRTTDAAPTVDEVAQSDREPDTEPESDDFDDNHDYERGLPPPVGMRPAAIAGAATTTQSHAQRNLQSSHQNVAALDRATASASRRSETPVLNLTDDDQAERGSSAAQDDDDDDDDDSSLLILHSSQPQPSTPLPSKRPRPRPHSHSHSRSPSQPTPTPPKGSSLSTLTCPICFGPPIPIAATSCGHVFCAPCLHAALLAGPELTPPPPPPGREGNARGNAFAFGRRLAPAVAAAGGIFNPSRGGRARTRAGANTNNRTGPYAHHSTAWGERIDSQDDDEELNDDDDDDEVHLPPNRNRQHVPPTPAPPPPPPLPPGELDKHCPVCRKPLRGGWGRALRGVVLRMEPKKFKEAGLGKGNVMEGDSDVERNGDVAIGASRNGPAR